VDPADRRINSTSCDAAFVHPVTVRGQPVTVREQRRAVGYAAWERRAERPMLVLALVFLVVLVVPMVTDLPPAGGTAFTVADVAIWAAFAVDYVARLYLAPARWRFVRSHLLDLLVLVVPFLRPLRALRLLRIARLGVVAGVAHSRAQRSLHATVAVYVTTAAAGLLVLAAAAMYDVERRAPSGNIKTFPDALWWAITTVTTVGYGDRYPTTGTGRLVGGALMLVGIALLGVITASIAAWFVDRLRDVQVAETTTEAALGEVLAELKALHTRLDAIERQPRVVEQAKPSSAPAPLPSQGRQR
jgi:voltage-gated potassium channel